MCHLENDFLSIFRLRCGAPKMSTMDNKDTKQEPRRVLIARVTATQLFQAPEKSEREELGDAEEPPAAEKEKEKE